MQDVLTAKEAAEFLRTTVDTVKRRARAGSIPAAKIGREWRFRRADLDAWLAGGGTLREQMEDEGIAIIVAERKSDPANWVFRPVEEVLRERGL